MGGEGAGEPTADGLQNELAQDVDNLTGLEIQDPGTGRRKAEPPQPPAAGTPAHTEARERLDTFVHFVELAEETEEDEWDGDVLEESSEDRRERQNVRLWRRYKWELVAILVAMALAAFLYGWRLLEPTAPLKESSGGGAPAASAPAASTGGAPAGTSAQAATRRWFMTIPQVRVKGEPIRYTIVLESNGSSGGVHWLEDPNAKGTFTFNGNEFTAVIVRPNVFANEANPDERTEFHMTLQPDGSLVGTVAFDNWIANHQHVVDTAQATGEPR
jgi:hypothetical protein